MKLRYINILKAAAVAVGVLFMLPQSAKADEVTVGFDDFKIGYGENWAPVLTLPDDWYYTLVDNVYESSTYGHTAKPSIAVNGVNTNSYIITPKLEGEFSFWLRNYSKNYQANVVAYECTYEDGNLNIGTKIDEKTLVKVSSPSFEKVTFTANVPTRVALLISRGCFDDFTYTPARAIEGASLMVSGYDRDSECDLGAVYAGTEHKFVLSNPGTATLNVSSVTVSSPYEIKSGADIKTVEPSQSVEVIVATPAQDAEGELRIVSDDPNGDYVIKLKSQNKVPKAQITLDKTSLDFGTAKDDASIDVKVTNSGDATLTATIASSDGRFEVNPSSLTVEPGKSEIFTVSFKYDKDDFGVHEALITIESNAGDPITLQASVEVPDPNVWSEDFEGGKLPQGWSTTGWTVTKLSRYSGGNETYMAYAGTSSSTIVLITPRLQASKGQKLSFFVGSNTDGTDKLYVEYSHDMQDWKPIEGAPLTSGGEYSFTAPEDGYYYLKFNGKYGAVDNFYGFKLALKEHDLSFQSENIPAEGHQYVEYTANVTVTEMMGNDEEISAYLYFGDEVMAEKQLTLSAGESEKISLSFVPQKGYSSAQAKVIVKYGQDEQLASGTVTVNIAEAAVWDEESDNELTAGTYQALVFKYKAKKGWNTIATPFALTKEYLNKIFGESYTVYELNDHANGIIKFKETTNYYSGYPYVVYVKDQVSDDEPESYSEEGETSIILTNVKVDQPNPQYDERKGVKVISNFSHKTAGADEMIYALNPEEKSLVPTETVKAFRAYVTLDPTVTTIPQVRFYDGNGVETGIGTVWNDASLPTGIFNMQGQPVKQPLQPGLYIIDGKKVLVK